MRIVPLLFLLLATNIVAATETYKCDYPTHSDPSGHHQTTKRFSLTFVVDAAKETSYMVGNAGSTEVNKIDGIDRTTFIEITESGNVMTTTIYLPDGDSVHSRNTVLIDELFPSQYYGRCVLQ